MVFRGLEEIPREQAMAFHGLLVCDHTQGDMVCVDGFGARSECDAQ